MNTADLSIEATANTAQAPQLQAALDGSVELLFWAKVEIARIDGHQPTQPRTEKNMSFQALPSLLSIGGKALARSHVGQLFGAVLDAGGRKFEQTTPVYWTLSRDHILAIEHARNGRAAEFSTRLAVAF